MWILCSTALGFLLDLCFGDPRWLPHPVVLIGKSISRLERFLRRKFPQTPEGERRAGVILAAAIPLGSLLLSLGILLLAYRISFWLWFVLHTFWAYQILAARCLERESDKVYRLLADGDLPGARVQLSYLVGRDTTQLTAEEVAKACVETVAENTSDGVTAPLLYLMIGGVPLGFCYKAINTLDSMVGYRNAKYLHLGRASAKLDDAANWLPSRICGLLLTVSAFLLRLDGKNAAAGALGIQLGGTHIYFGDVVEKPTIGDAVRLAEPEDIRRTNGMMFAASGLSLLGFGLLRFAAVLLFR